MLGICGRIHTLGGTQLESTWKSMRVDVEKFSFGDNLVFGIWISEGLGPHAGGPSDFWNLWHSLLQRERCAKNFPHLETPEANQKSWNVNIIKCSWNQPGHTWRPAEASGDQVWDLTLRDLMKLDFKESDWIKSMADLHLCARIQNLGWTQLEST